MVGGSAARSALLRMQTRHADLRTYRDFLSDCGPGTHVQTKQGVAQLLYQIVRGFASPVRAGQDTARGTLRSRARRLPRVVSTGMASVRGSGPSARSWRATYGPPVYGHRSDDLSQTADGSRARPLRGLLLVILLGVGTHASKQSLGPLEPTLHAAGMGPLGFGALTVVPGIASIVLPTVWGAAWAKRAPLVLVLSPLAQLMAQTLLVTGLSPMADGWLAASAITLGLFLFSLGRAGIAVAQHSMLARTFTTNPLHLPLPLNPTPTPIS